MSNNSIIVHLPNGSSVDVYTRNGAHAFIQKPGPFDYFTSNIESANRIRQKAKENNGRKLTPKEKQQLEVTYLMADALAGNSDENIFNKIPESEIGCWMDHVMEQIAEKTKDRRWIQTGILSERCDTFLLNPCIAMLLHPVPIRLAFEKGFFQVLSDFIASRKAPSLPCTDIAETVVMLVSNAVCYIWNNQDMISLTVEKALKKLESSGMLVQYIRCSTIPQLIGNMGVSKLYDELIKCPALIKKKFRTGHPCGDVVNDILNGTKYSKRNVEVIKKLKIVSSFADIMQPSHCEEGTLQKGLKLCRYCSKSGNSTDFQMSLKACGRCKHTYYCSRDCQVDDWKIHKTTCRLATKSDYKNNEGNQQTIWNFSKRNYVEIMERFVSVCDDTGLDKSELLLELDFKPNENGMAPALQEQPEFKVANTRDYFEGSRPNEPDWFFKSETEDQEIFRYEDCVGPVVANVKDIYTRLTKNHILCLVRFPSVVSVARLQMEELDNGNEIFSHETLNAVRSAINDDNFGPLEGIFREDSRIMRELRMKFGMANASDMDRTGMVLDMMTIFR